MADVKKRELFEATEMDSLTVNEARCGNDTENSLAG